MRDFSGTGGLCLTHGVPGQVCLPMGRGRLCLLVLSEWGGGPCLSRVLGGWLGGGFWARRVPTLGSCFSWFLPLPTASLLPGRAPPRPHSIPVPGAASTIPLICNDFCLFLSFSFSALPRPGREHAQAPSLPSPVRFVSGLFAELSMKDPCNYSRALQ